MSRVRAAVDRVCALPFGVQPSRSFQDDVAASLTDWCFRGASELQDAFDRMFYLTYAFKGATVRGVTADHLRIGSASFANETAVSPTPPDGREHDQISLRFWLCLTPATWAKLKRQPDSDAPLSLEHVSLLAHEAMKANWPTMTVPSLRRTLAHELYHYLQTRATPKDKRSTDIKSYRQPPRPDASPKDHERGFASYYRQATEVGAFAAQVAEQFRERGITLDELKQPGAMEKYLSEFEPALVKFYLRQGGDAKKRFLTQIYQHLSR